MTNPQALQDAIEQLRKARAHEQEIHDRLKDHEKKKGEIDWEKKLAITAVLDAKNAVDLLIDKLTLPHGTRSDGSRS